MKLTAYFEGAAKDLQRLIDEAEVERTKPPYWVIEAQINAALMERAIMPRRKLIVKHENV